MKVYYAYTFFWRKSARVKAERKQNCSLSNSVYPVFSSKTHSNVKMRGQLGAYFVWIFVQIDAQSSSTPSLIYNTSYSANMSINPTTNVQQKSSTQSKPTGVTQTCNFGNLTVCWLQSPPYIMNQSTGNMTGIFHDAINDLFNQVCNGKSRTWLNYTYEAKTISELNECMSKDFDIVFPILFSPIKNDLYRKLRFQELIRSPGIALVKDKVQLEQKAKWNVLKEFLQTWTVLVLAVLLSAIFGILIWALDSNSNAEEFPPGFCRGSLEGIWWAFVSMTTVGYGDKTPKFLLARVVGVVWLFVGIIVMAYLSAIMTTSLTTGTLTDYTDVMNKELGVLADSQAFKEGLEHGAILTMYEDLDALTNALAKDEVEGILLDVYTASYRINRVWNHNDTKKRFKQVKILDAPFLIGFFMLEPSRNPYLNGRITSKSQQFFDNGIYSIASNYVGRICQGRERKESWSTRLYFFRSDEPFFQMGLYILSGILASLVVLGLVWELFTRQRKQTFQLDNKDHGKGVNMDVLLTTRELRSMMDNICEVEKCMGKILELKDAYGKLNDYWSEQKSEGVTLLMNSAAQKI